MDENSLNQGYWEPEDTNIKTYPRRVKPDHTSPANFTWANVNGVNYLTN
eukprot:CAMPEP_0168341402 /NCGR_PEP_ID=MMETSP0213-20121227/14662_1 /TAXON_ID=151035 /ORGANISM="Euplotes harpa, Strain FSP1.4" /LENGTH=48 /DNA_ID= /DNA_START= /DNA_END= /DNA_ORIENTATION=